MTTSLGHILAHYTLSVVSIALRVEITESQRKEAVESSDFEMKQKNRDELLQIIQQLQGQNIENEEKLNGLRAENVELQEKVKELEPKEETFGGFIGGLLGMNDENEEDKKEKSDGIFMWIYSLNILQF